MSSSLFAPGFAKDLVPGKVRFTSKQGRERRTRILNAAKEILAERDPNEITFAQLCSAARIPRASAYHFFPSLRDVFLALRILQAEAILEAVRVVDQESFETWVAYYRRLIDEGARVLRADPAGTKLTYGSLDGFSEAHQLGRAVDAQLAQAAIEAIDRRFITPEWPGRERIFAVAFTIVDSLFKLSYRQEGRIDDWYVEEAKRAGVAYLRNYVPDHLPERQTVDPK